jgi:hypothetical protein
MPEEALEAAKAAVDAAEAADFDALRISTREYVASLALRGNDAEQELSAAWPRLEPYQTSLMLAGPVAALALWWHLRARLQAAQQDHAGAVLASREAVAYRRRLAEMPHLEHPMAQRASLADALTLHADILEGAGDVAGANAARTEASDIHAAIGLP